MDSRGRKFGNLWQPVGRDPAPKGRLKLQSCRFAGAEAQKVGLDWIGFEWLLERYWWLRAVT